MNYIDVAKKLGSANFIFAKSIPKFPHFYTLRKDWDEKEFENIVVFIRENGKVRNWCRQEYIYYDLNGYEYWTMGASISETILINKAKKRTMNEYDSIAEVYDSLFTDDRYKEEDKMLLETLDIRGRVLDVGCGTGLLIDYIGIEPYDYTGIDVSLPMLQRFTDKHPHFTECLLNVGFEDFYQGRFDTLVMLFGVASYIDNTTITRVKDMLKEGGKAYLMYYKDDYYPVTYSLTGINPEHNGSPVPELGECREFNNYIIQTING